jgi:hypothetical protein
MLLIMLLQKRKGRRMKEMQWVKECHEMLTCAHRKIVSTFERYDFLAVLDYKM